MIEIWQECASFQTTSQKFADQVRTIIKKGWLSDLEIQEIHQKTHKSDTLSGTNQKQPYRNELPFSEKENATLPNNVQPSNPKETLTQEQKRIWNSEKTNLPSLKNIDHQILIKEQT